MDNPTRVSKATYGLPLALFPADELVESWFKEGMSALTPYEQELRSLAWSSYVKINAPDKELTRFMIPALSWSEADESGSSYISLGTSSWIASVDQAPFIPMVCRQLLTSFAEEPRSLLHLIGATFTCMRIMYCAESLEEVVLDNFPDGREVLLVVIEPGVSVRIVDTMNAQGLSARVVLGNVASRGHVRWVSDLASTSASFLQHDRWYQDKASQLEVAQVLTGGQQSWLRREFQLGHEAQMSYTCLTALQGDEQTALTTVQEHLGSSSTSTVLVKTAISERSRSFYRGTIAIAPEAPKSVASQQQKALLLSPDSRTCAIPSLEVATHEVQCAHGSAAGQCNEDELWYLSSRGLNTYQAKRLLIEGFFNEPVVTQNPEMRERLMRRVL